MMKQGSVQVEIVVIAKIPVFPFIADENKNILSCRFKLTQVFPEGQSEPQVVFEDQSAVKINLVFAATHASLEGCLQCSRQIRFGAQVSSLE